MTKTVIWVPYYPAPAAAGITTTAVSGDGAEASSVTGNAVTPTGTTRAVFGVSCAFFDTSDMKYGGSGGTSLTKLGSTVTAFFGTTLMTIYGAAASPNTSTTAYALFGGSAVCAMSEEFMNGVNQVTPFNTGSIVTNNGSSAGGSSFTATLGFTGLTPGAEVRAGFGLSTIGGGTFTSSTVTAGTETARHTSPSSSGQMRTMILKATVDGSGNATVTVDVVLSASVAYGWCVAGCVVNT